MMMFSSYFVHESPFDYVYIHGLVLDEHHRKMSKSLGNGIEPQTVIDEYGNDAMRIFFLSDSASGEDISFKPTKLKQAFNFLIKL
ncbi:class I tRNA ligase family protein [bacterium]|nr:class I tRNA ligase family protein [bacterium]